MRDAFADSFLDGDIETDVVYDHQRARLGTRSWAARAVHERPSATRGPTCAETAMVEPPAGDPTRLNSAPRRLRMGPDIAKLRHHIDG